MRLVGYHNDIAAIGQDRIIGRAGLGREFLQGREDHAAGRPVEQLAQMLAVLGLLRRLAQQVLAKAERAEQLVVEVVAVGQHDERRVRHRRVLDDLAGVECHQQALARALGVPDHADLAVTARRRRFQRAGHGAAHRVELVVACEDFDDFTVLVAEDDEILDDVEQVAAVEHALQNRLKLRLALRREIVAGDSPPGHEAFAIRRQRADARDKTVRSHQGGMSTAEQRPATGAEQKSASCVRGENGQVKVTDFGIAKAISSSKTKTGIILGTPNYMSPEQIMGQKIDSKSDIFSLGVLFYQLLTGELPFHGDNLSGLLYQITQVKHASCRTINPRIPKACEQILDRALAKNPAQRFRTAGEMAHILRVLGEKMDQLKAKKAEQQGEAS